MTIIEYLNKLTVLAMENGELNLYNKLTVESHLTFTNEIMFFSTTSTKFIMTVKSILREFSKISGS